MAGSDAGQAGSGGEAGAPTLDGWITQAGNRVVPYGLVALDDGSVVATGNWLGDTTFGLGEPNETTLSATVDARFLARWDSSGQLMWATRVCDQGWGGVGLALLANGDLVTTGTFIEPTVFGVGEPDETPVTPNGDGDAYVARYRPDGTLVRVITFGGAHSTRLDQGIKVAALDDGSFVATGRIRYQTVFGAGEPNETIVEPNGNGNTYVARFNADLSLQWVKIAFGANWNQPAGLVALDGDSVAVTGTYAETITFGPGEPNETILGRVGPTDAYLAKYNLADGTLAWAQRISGMDQENGYGLAALPGGNMVVTGLVTQGATFGEGQPGEIRFTTPNQQAFVARFDSDGTLAWAKEVGGPYNDAAYSLTVLPDGDVAVNINNGGDTLLGAFEPGQLTVHGTPGFMNGLIAVFDDVDGHFVSLLGHVVHEGNTGATASTILPGGDLAVAGYFNGTTTFHFPSGATQDLTVRGTYHDLFLWRSAL